MDHMNLHYGQDNIYVIQDALKIASQVAIHETDRRAFASLHHMVAARTVKQWGEQPGRRERGTALRSIGAIWDELELGASSAGEPPEIIASQADTELPPLPKRVKTEHHSGDNS